MDVIQTRQDKRRRRIQIIVNSIKSAKNPDIKRLILKCSSMWGMSTRVVKEYLEMARFQIGEEEIDAEKLIQEEKKEIEENEIIKAEIKEIKEEVEDEEKNIEKREIVNEEEKQQRKKESEEEFNDYMKTLRDKKDD